MAEVVPLLASSVLVLREATDPARIEVLMIRRHLAASFMPDTWVFPGGVLDEIDRDVASENEEAGRVGALRVTAVRELFEETGVWLGRPMVDRDKRRRRLRAGNLGFRAILEDAPVDFRRLVWTSHWITPVGMPKRFDTYFFLAASPPDADPSAAEEEASEVRWFTPEDALSSLKLAFPTARNLEALRGHISVSGLMDSRRGVEIPTTIPRLVDGKIVLP